MSGKQTMLRRARLNPPCAFTGSIPFFQNTFRRPHLSTRCHAQPRNGCTRLFMSKVPGEDHHSSNADELHPSWRVYSLPGNPCILCSGQGEVKCLYCFGDGVVRIGPEDARDTLDCPQCKGKSKEVCARCRGSGIRPETRLNPETGEVYRNLTNKEVRTSKQRGKGIVFEDKDEEQFVEENVEQLL